MKYLEIFDFLMLQFIVLKAREWKNYKFENQG